MGIFDFFKKNKNGSNKSVKSKKYQDKEELYDNGVIKKKTEFLPLQNVWLESLYDESGNMTERDVFLLEEKRLTEKYLYKDQENKDQENFEKIFYYEGGETRHSSIDGGLQEGVEKVFDKDGNLIEEHTYKYGINTYYKKFINGEIIEERDVEEDLSEYDGGAYFDVSMDFNVLYKSGKEVASGFICLSCNSNEWNYDAEANNEDLVEHYWEKTIKKVMIVNDKLFTDYDQEESAYTSNDYKDDFEKHPEKYKSKKIANFLYEDEAEKFFKNYVNKKDVSNAL